MRTGLAMERNGGHPHLVPGIEPSVEFLSEVKARDVYPLIEKALIKAAETSGYDALYLPTNPNILSNRPDIAREAQRRYAKSIVQLPVQVQWNHIPGPYPFSEVYEIWHRSTSVPAPAVEAPKTTPQPELDGFLQQQGLNQPFTVQDVARALGKTETEAQQLLDAEPRVVPLADGRYEQHGAMGAAGAGELSAPEAEPSPNLAEPRPNEEQESLMDKVDRLIRTQRMTERMP